MSTVRRTLLNLLVFGIAFISPVLGEVIDLVILHVNDTHGKLFPHDSNEGKNIGGIGRLSTLVTSIRDVNPDRVLFLHGGDMFSRGVPATIYSGGLVNLLAFEAMGVDAMTPGNGEFYWGMENLERQTSRVSTPFVHANVTYKNSDASIFPPYVIRDIQGVRVGILGLGLIRSWHYTSQTFTLHDPVESAIRYAREIRPQVDLLIALTHIGIKNDSLVAAAVPGLDLIVGGIPIRVSISHRVSRDQTGEVPLRLFKRETISSFSAVSTCGWKRRMAGIAL